MIERILGKYQLSRFYEKSVCLHLHYAVTNQRLSAHTAVLCAVLGAQRTRALISALLCTGNMKIKHHEKIIYRNSRDVSKL